MTLDRRRRRGRLDLEFERTIAAARAAGDLDVAIRTDRRSGIDAVDAAVDTVAQIGKNHGAVSDFDALDAGRIGFRCAGRSRAPRGWVGGPSAFAQQRHVQHRADDDEFGDLRPARPHARKRDVGLDAGGGQAIAAVAVFRILQRDVVHRHVQRRPHPDPGGAGDAEAIAGVAFDPGLDRRGHEARGDPDDQQQPRDDDHGGNGGACDFQCSHHDIPDQANGIEFGQVPAGRGR